MGTCYILSVILGNGNGIEKIFWNKAAAVANRQYLRSLGFDAICFSENETMNVVHSYHKGEV